MIEKIIIALKGEIERLIRDHTKKMARADKVKDNPESYEHYAKHAKLIADRIKHYKELINFLEKNQ